MKTRTLAIAAGAALLIVGLAAVVSGRSDRPTAPAGTPPLPRHLRDTGLYRDDVLPFAPQYPLWTDGATKRRWIRLPPGSTIDASDPDTWSFPVGTRLWKEFAFGRRIETRYLERLPGGDWRFAVYLWNADGTDAVLSLDGASIDLGDGRRHDVPSAAECRLCHEAGASVVLGFSALQLSGDRDPGALHVEAPPPGAIDLPALIASGRLVGMTADQAAPRIAAETPTERAARGYLHGNCGGCHDDRGALAALDLDLRHALGDPAGRAAPALATTLGHRSRARLPDDPDAAALRIVAGDPDHSVLVGRMRSRAPASQMPPLGTRMVDDEAVALIARWIAELDRS